MHKCQAFVSYVFIRVHVCVSCETGFKVLVFFHAKGEQVEIQKHLALEKLECIEIKRDLALAFH